MIYVIGLGNPGEKYETTRHNSGRIILESIGKGFDFDMDKKLNALVAKDEIDGEKVTFVLPETFMNKSGKSVAPLIKSKKDLDKLVVIYDDIDLPIGKIKLTYNRGDGGHNGLASIIRALKSKAFLRIRVGVSPATPSGKIKKPKGDKAILNHLLGNFKPKELEKIKKLSKKISETLSDFSEFGREKAMSLFNN